MLSNKTMIFTNLNELVKEENRIGTVMNESLWLSMPYEIGEYKGNLLLAGEDTTPQNITLQLGLSGWHKIYICMLNFRSINYTYFKLSDDETYTGMRSPVFTKERNWCKTEYADEFFWKCADLTGQNIIIKKPDSYFLHTSGVVWIKCIPMTEAELEEYWNYSATNKTKCMQCHIDEDPNGEDAGELLVKEYALKNTDFGLCSLEISFDYDTPENREYYPIIATDKRWSARDYLFFEQKEDVYRNRIEMLHNFGIEVYAANRMSVSDFYAPYSRLSWGMEFARNNPEYHCIMRDGRRANISSYAYKEVWQYILEVFKKYICYGFDGITLIYHRGLYMGFEEPVIKRFAELYPEVDAKRLPIDDVRLQNVWCEFMTEFMKYLSEELDLFAGRHININVITDYSPEMSRRIGLDIEKWAEIGVVDIITQGDMEIYEDLEGCLCEDGLIDLELYKEKQKKNPILKRSFCTDTEKTIRGIKKYSEICNRYNIDFYAILPWAHSIAPDQYEDIVAKMREAGAKRFFSWNTNHLMWDLPEYHTVSMLANSSVNREYSISKTHRTLSLGGSDVACFNPNWRG